MTLRPGQASYEGRAGDETSSSSQAMRYEDQADGSVRMTEIRSNGGDGEYAVAVQPTRDTLVVRRQGGQVMPFRRTGSGGNQPAGK